MGRRVLEALSGFPISILNAHEVMGVNAQWQPRQPTAITIHRTPFSWRFGIAQRTDEGERWFFIVTDRPSQLDILRTRNNWNVGFIRLVIDAIVEQYPNVTAGSIMQINLGQDDKTEATDT